MLPFIRLSLCIVSEAQFMHIFAPFLSQRIICKVFVPGQITNSPIKCHKDSISGTRSATKKAADWTKFHGPVSHSATGLLSPPALTRFQTLQPRLQLRLRCQFRCCHFHLHRHCRPMDVDVNVNVDLDPWAVLARKVLNKLLEEPLSSPSCRRGPI